MNDIINLTYQYKILRTQIINEETYFCLKDICEILQISNHRHVVTQIDLKGVVKADSLTDGGKQELLFINEPNLYRVIFRSNKQEAKNFQDWVFNDVLPSIRKHGTYTNEKAYSKLKRENELLEWLLKERNMDLANHCRREKYLHNYIVDSGMEKPKLRI